MPMDGQDPRDPASIVALMRSNQSFKPLPDAALLHLAMNCTINQGTDGQRLFTEGEDGDFAYLVIAGEVSVHVISAEHDTTIATVGPGGLVGEIAAFANVPRTASVTAKGDTSLLKIDQANIRDVLKQSPDAAMGIIADLGRRLASNNETMAMLTQAAKSLAEGDYRPMQLGRLQNAARRFRHFAEVFDGLAQEITEKRLRTEEMRTAAEIQNSFLPNPITDGLFRDRFDVAAIMQAAKQVGGDYYDYFMIDSETIGFAVGDVSGKGVPAAMFMSVTRTMLKALAREGGDAGDVVTRVNNLLAEDNDEGTFVTLVFARLNLDTGELDFAVAGHEELFFIDKDGGLSKWDALGPAMGLFEGPEFETHRTEITPGTSIVMVTDGVTEAFNASRELYGSKRLKALIDHLKNETAQAIVDGIYADVLDYADGHPQSDDITCLALRYLP
ncbi:MAG: SpoIIE family protein phosphatase [Pseudomonadota bacterium]